MKKFVFLLFFVSTVTWGQTKDMPTSFSQSYELESKGQYAKAAEALMDVYSDHSYEINLRLGWLYYLSADYVKSQNYYKIANKIYPKSVESKLGLVYPTAALQNWNEVTRLYEEVLTVDPLNTRANFQLGVIYLLKKDYKKALEYTDKVFELYPFDYDTNVLLVKIYKGMNKIQEAKACFKRVQSYNPTSSEIPTLSKGL